MSYGSQKYNVIKDETANVNTKSGPRQLRKLLLGKEKAPTGYQRIHIPQGMTYQSFDSRGQATNLVAPQGGINLVLAVGLDVNPQTGRVNGMDLVSFSDWNNTLATEGPIPPGSTVVVEVERLYPSSYTPPPSATNPAPTAMMLMNLQGSVTNIVRRAENQPTSSLPPNSQGAYQMPQQPTAIPVPAAAPEWQ